MVIALLLSLKSNVLIFWTVYLTQGRGSREICNQNLQGRARNLREEGQIRSRGGFKIVTLIVQDESQRIEHGKVCIN